MLQRVDRMQLAVRDRRAAVQAFTDVLGAEQVRDDELRSFGANRTVVQAGESEFELLEPAGDGAVASHLERWGEGIFAAGVSPGKPRAPARRKDGPRPPLRGEGGADFFQAPQKRGRGGGILRRGG